MDDAARLGPWVRRFLLEHLIGERNLSVNTQRSYRDTLALLIRSPRDKSTRRLMNSPCLTYRRSA